MKKSSLMLLAFGSLFLIIFLTGCSFVQSYTYYELDSEGFESTHSIRMPARGQNIYLPMNDNKIILYQDPENYAEITFTCFNDFSRYYTCGPLWFPVIPVFGYPTEWNPKSLSHLSMSLNYWTFDVEIKVDDMQITTPDGKTYPVKDIDSEMLYRTFDKKKLGAKLEAHLDEEWYDSFQVDLGEITINDTLVIHPVIDFKKDTIIGWTALPFWI